LIRHLRRGLEDGGSAEEESGGEPPENTGLPDLGGPANPER